MARLLQILQIYTITLVLVMKMMIIEFQGNGVVVAGDGRMDSPGHSAQYCVYSVMEHDSSKLMDVQVSPVFFRLSIAINA